jgi:hypothetical protein
VLAAVSGTARPSYGQAADKPAPEDRTAKVTGVDPQPAGLRNRITVRFANLPADRLASDWRLYLDGVLIKGIAPDNADGPQSNELHFQLDRTKESKDAWAKLLRHHEFHRKVRVGLGTEEKPDPAVKPGELDMIVRPRDRLWWVLGGWAVLLVALVLLGVRTSLLRSRGYDTPAGQKPLYSLGWTQMAFWLFLVLAAYLYIAVVTTDVTESLTDSVLVLLGISAATAFGAYAIDANKQARRQTLTAEKPQLAVAQLTAQTKMAAAPATDLPALQVAVLRGTQRAAEIDATLDSLPDTTAGSKGFFADLISDADGVSLHRLQLVIWTLVFGVVFVTEVYNRLAMPEFSPTMLALIGISSGSYIGFKFPEKKT